MTKETFENYDGDLFCKCCKRNVPKIHMHHKKVYADGSVARCNVCEWIKRHKGIPTISGYSENEIVTALYFFIYEKSEFINELATEIGRTIEDTIKLFQNLKIVNKKCLIQTVCNYCGKPITETPMIYLQRKHLYCSYDCYWESKRNDSENHGENNIFYRRITTQCTNCHKEIKIIPSKYEKTNSYGDNHNFCSTSCYWEFRSKYYVGEKSIMYNYEFSDEQREKMRYIAFTNSRNSERFNSSIQLKIDEILRKNNIEFEREYIIKYYAIDNYLPETNLFIEVMGDYWHSSPLKYNEDKYLLNETQLKGIKHDKQKHSYLLNHYGVEILYLWEYDINNNPNLCEQLILSYINNSGYLENYHSFNWSLKNNSLVLNNSLVVPYQSMNIENYRHLAK